MKKIRLQVACRYLQRYGGELEGERGYINMAGWIGNPPEKVIPYTQGVSIFLHNAQHQRIAEVTAGLPAESGYLFTRTGEFKSEVAY